MVPSAHFHQECHTTNELSKQRNVESELQSLVNCGFSGMDD